MDLCYFKDKIYDELCGAKEYVLKAMENKTSHPSWSKVLIDMSSAELNHATNLYKMFEEHYTTVISSYTEVPKNLKELHEEVVECYTAKSAKIHYMHDLYKG